MASFQHFKRRSIIPLVGMALAAYYGLVMVPLSRRAKALDAPLESAWQKLSTALDQTNASAIDFLHITNQLVETHQAFTLLENAKQKTAARLELSASVRTKMSQPFRLVEYENERSRQQEQMTNLAKKAEVTLEPAVLAGFPENKSDIKQAVFLWAALSMVDNLLATAVQCKVSVIHSLAVPLALTNEPPAALVTEIPLQLELTGSASSVLKLLQSLPLRAEEMRAEGLPEARPGKVPLFIDRLIIKKQSPDKSDEVSVSFRALGFVLRE